MKVTNEGDARSISAITPLALYCDKFIILTREDKCDPVSRDDDAIIIHVEMSSPPGVEEIFGTMVGRGKLKRDMILSEDNGMTFYCTRTPKSQKWCVRWPENS